MEFTSHRTRSGAVRFLGLARALRPCLQAVPQRGPGTQNWQNHHEHLPNSPEMPGLAEARHEDLFQMSQDARISRESSCQKQTQVHITQVIQHVNYSHVHLRALTLAGKSARMSQA
eukprot:964406-Pelagomonas_calceolata.AAC.1